MGPLCQSGMTKGPHDFPELKVLIVICEFVKDTQSKHSSQWDEHTLEAPATYSDTLEDTRNSSPGSQPMLKVFIEIPSRKRGIIMVILKVVS